MKKKSFCGFGIFLILIMCFISCGGKKSSLNEFGFYEDLDEAKEVARKQKKDILLFITMEGYDDSSIKLKEDILVTEEFKSLLGDKFVGVHFDFGEASYAASEVRPGATKDEQTAAEEKTARIAKNMQFARLMNVQYTPVAFILTEDGYYVADLQYSESFENARDFAYEVNEYAEDLAEFKSLIEATKKGSVVERMNAINNVYEYVDPSYLPTCAPLFRQAAEIDKKNESGLVSRLYMESVLTDSMIYYAVGDFGSAIQIFTTAAQSGKLEPMEQQEAYYMAGYLLGTSGSDDYETILGYLTLAVQANPSGSDVPRIQNIINSITSMVEAEMQSNQAESGAQ